MEDSTALPAQKVHLNKTKKVKDVFERAWIQRSATKDLTPVPSPTRSYVDPDSSDQESPKREPAAIDPDIEQIAQVREPTTTPPRGCSKSQHLQVQKQMYATKNNTLPPFHELFAMNLRTGPAESPSVSNSEAGQESEVEEIPDTDAMRAEFEQKIAMVKAGSKSIIRGVEHRKTTVEDGDVFGGRNGSDLPAAQVRPSASTADSGSQPAELGPTSIQRPLNNSPAPGSATSHRMRAMVQNTVARPRSPQGAFQVDIIKKSSPDGDLLGDDQNDNPPPNVYAAPIGPSIKTPPYHHSPSVLDPKPLDDNWLGGPCTKFPPNVSFGAIGEIYEAPLHQLASTILTQQSNLPVLDSEEFPFHPDAKSRMDGTGSHTSPPRPSNRMPPGSKRFDDRPCTPISALGSKKSPVSQLLPTKYAGSDFKGLGNLKIVPDTPNGSKYKSAMPLDASYREVPDDVNIRETSKAEDFAFWAYQPRLETGASDEIHPAFRVRDTQMDLDRLSQYLAGDADMADLYAFAANRSLPPDAFKAPLRASSDTWGRTQEQSWASNRSGGDGLAPAAMTSEIQLIEYSPSKHDRILSAHDMTLKALGQKSSKHASIDFPPAISQEPNHSFGSFVHANSTRPPRPQSDVDSFVMLHPGDGYPRACHEQRFKPPPGLIRPDAFLFAPANEVVAHAGLSTAVSTPSSQTRKQVQSIPSLIQEDDSNYVAPDQYIPPPYPRALLVSDNSSSSHPATSPPTEDNNSHPMPSPRGISNDDRARSASRTRKPNKPRLNLNSVYVLPVSCATAVEEKIALLTLFVHRRQVPDQRQKTQIELPKWPFKTLLSSAMLDASPGKEVASPTAYGQNSEKYFASLEFDDQVFFTQLRTQYYDVLLGVNWLSRTWRRWFSARTLKRVRVVALSRGGEQESAYGEDTPEKELMEFFRHPRFGIARYSWVHWAQRISRNASVSTGAPDTSSPNQQLGIHSEHASNGSLSASLPSRRPQLVRGASGTTTDAASELFRKGQRTPQVHALEFIEGWSVYRILLAIVAVFLAAVGVCVLWIFLGPNADAVAASVTAASVDVRIHAYSNDSVSGQNTITSQLQETRTERVGAGVSMFMVVLFGGWIGVVAWMGMSWVVM